jgi:membrane dipeptidase
MRLRRVALVIIVVLTAAVAALAVLGARIEGMRNPVTGPPLPPVSPAAADLHRASLVVDLHADPLLWGRNLLARGHVGQVDLPRLRDGGVGLQVFGIVTAFPVTANVARTDPRWPDAITLLALGQGWPLATLRSRTARARYQSGEFARMVEKSGGLLLPIRSRADLDALLARRRRDPRVIGGMLAIEGAHALDGEVGNVGPLFDGGVRMLGLAHFFDNAFAGSAHGLEKGGLTEKGRALVREMERRGIVLDLAHASAATITDALAIAGKPPVVSHTGVRATCDNPRNLSDDQVRAVARAGGVVGIGVWETAVCGTDPQDVARAIAYVVALVGDEHAALGTDFDGAVTTRFDATGLPAITAALLDEGLSEASIRRVLGENALRVFRAVLPAS